ncbi:MAG: galactokinase, partial [Candidatus Omnitrophica bacterium]|nr:galactokinase [Candidatus Omnitrophota bacterium]
MSIVIVKVPFRVSIGGGGTDLPEYQKRYGGLLITSTINKYMHVFVGEPATSDKIKLYHHSKESVNINEIGKIEHNIIRESLKLHNIQRPIEISSFSDIESGTGMGSSSVFTVGLLAGLNTLERKFISPHDLAEEACKVEIDLVGKPIGKQDQYAATFGGINKLYIDKKGRVTVTPLKFDKETIFELENRLLMFYTGVTRDANEILAEQGKKIKDKTSLNCMHTIKQIGIEIEQALLNGNITEFGRLLHHHWTIKKEVSNKMSSDKIDELYRVAQINGAIGGKIIGAGGSGFILLCVKEGKRKAVKCAMLNQGLRFMDFRFEFEGCKVLTN